MALNNQKHIIDLWMQFLNGNEMAFSELYCLSFDELLIYGCKVGGNSEMVEDILQDLFLKLYQRKIVLDDNTKLRPFLYKALKNQVYNQLLRNSKLQSLVEYEFDLKYTIDNQFTIINVEDISDEVQQILSCLTSRQKEIIYLRFVHEMTFEEISEIMEINIQSARNLITRSMEKLRKESRPYVFYLLISTLDTIVN